MNQADTSTGVSPVRLSVRGVDAVVGGRTVVRDVTFDLPAGESLALVGANGSGKSTLLRALAGLTRPARGSVLVDGIDLHRMRPRDRGRAVAFVAQDERPTGGILAGELVALGLTPHRNPWSAPSRDDRAAVLAALGAVGLAGLADRPVEEMSGGERRRVLVARGLVQRAGLVLLDEPTNHLDVEHQLALLSLVHRLNRTVVAAVHDLDLAAAWFDRVALIHDGRIAAAGPPDAVLTPRAVEEALGVTSTPVVHPVTGDVHLLMTCPSHPRPARPKESR